MATLKTIWLLPVFVLGMCVGAVSFSHTRSEVRELTPTIDLSQPIVIYSCDNPSEEWSLTPYRSCIDGVRKSINEPPHGEAPAYRIDMDKGRVVVYATKGRGVTP